MVDWNPNFPDTFGLEWLTTRDQKNRVFAGTPARMQRIRSTAAETISSLKMSATVDPLVKSSIPTMIDVFEEGNEFVGTPKLTRLIPNSDNTNDGWTTEAGGSSNIFNSINEQTARWPVSDPSDIRTTTPTTVYVAGVNATLFNSGGAAENGRIFWVEVGAILAANNGYRKLDLALQIDGVLYSPAGGSRRDVHGFGATYIYWWGEINPATGLPWVPADIAKFDTESDWGIYVRSHTANASFFPRVMSLSLNVYYSETENREAVGVWRRPEDIGDERLINVETDALLTMPTGAANWAKATDTNYLFYWRQSISPSEYGPVVADDVRWNGVVQDLGPGGQPPGVVYPLTASGTPPPGSTDLASDTQAYDQFGRPQMAFRAGSRAAYALALVSLVASLPVDSVDSQPYRLDIADLVFLRSGTGTTGQRITPGSTQSYLGVRFPVIPPTSRDGTLTVTIHRVSDSLQMGGTFSITADEVRALPQIDGIRYVDGFLSSGATLVSGTQYEIRLTTTVTQQDWLLYAPDCSLAPSTSFGGATDGAMVAGSHDTDRDMAITLIAQPDAPTGVTANAIELPVTVPDTSTVQVEHVEVEWVAPASPLGGQFFRFELERQLTDETTWTRVANLNDVTLLSFVDHLVPRGFAATYRVRQVALDGRISQWATSAAVTPQQGDYDILLTSNHDPSLEVVLDIPDQAASYSFISTDRDEILALHGADNQVVFTESENRGVGWSATIELNFGTEPAIIRTGQRLFTDLLEITRSRDIPFVAAMDFQGTRILGHVRPGDAQQREPGHRYTASIEVTPTYTVEVPVEVEP
jgi:hypothetical protein